MRTGATENAGQRLTKDAVSPTKDVTAAAGWLRLIAIPIITVTEVSAIMSNGKEADKRGLVTVVLSPGVHLLR
jgi:hypothetical protein